MMKGKALGMLLLSAIIAIYGAFRLYSSITNNNPFWMSFAMFVLSVSMIIFLLWWKIPRIINQEYEDFKESIHMKSDSCEIVCHNIEKYIDRRSTEFGQRVSMLGIAIGMITFALTQYDKIGDVLCRSAYLGLLISGMILCISGLIISFVRWTNHNPGLKGTILRGIEVDYTCL